MATWHAKAVIVISFLLEEKSYCLHLEISIITFYDIFNWKHFIQELHRLLAAGKLVAKMSTAESWHAFCLFAISPPRQSQPSGRAKARWERTALMGSTRLSISALHIFMDGPSLTPTVSLPCPSCLNCLLVNKMLLWQTWQCRKGFEQQKMSLVLVRKRRCSSSTAVPIGKRGGLPWLLNHSLRATVTTSCRTSPWVWRVLSQQKSQTNVAAVLSSHQLDPGKISPHDTAHSPLHSLGSFIYPPAPCTHTTHTHTPL